MLAMHALRLLPMHAAVPPAGSQHASAAAHRATSTSDAACACTGCLRQPGHACRHAHPLTGAPDSRRTGLVDVGAGRRLVARNSDGHARAVAELHHGLNEALPEGALARHGRAPIVLQCARQHLRSARIQRQASCNNAWALAASMPAVKLQQDAELSPDWRPEPVCGT